MFVLLSKTFGLLTIPSNLIFVLVLVGAALIRTRLARIGRIFGFIGAILLLVAGSGPAGNALILALEQRFPPDVEDSMPPTGIVVLGGSIDPDISRYYQGPVVTEAADRLFSAAVLARRFPQARIVFSGGNANPASDAPAEAIYARELLERLGVPRSRIDIEDRSQNTAENAAFTAALVQPRQGERWLLVTSAYHMPRAVGCFRRVGFDVAAYPTDWTNSGWSRAWLSSAAISKNLVITDLAAHELIGLLIYWMTDRTSELFPGPR